MNVPMRLVVDNVEVQCVEKFMRFFRLTFSVCLLNFFFATIFFSSSLSIGINLAKFESAKKKRKKYELLKVIVI